MYTSRTKLHKDKGAEPTEFEESVTQALFDLENTNQELKSELKDLYINSVVQIDVAGSQKTVIIHVPFRLRKAFRKIHVKLVRELEKKFSDKDVIFVVTRRILRPPQKGSAAQRPHSWTLTFVQYAILEDVVVPAEIVGKRVKYCLDGSKMMKLHFVFFSMITYNLWLSRAETGSFIKLKRAHNIEIMLIMVKMPPSDMMVLQRWVEHVQRVEHNIWRALILYVAAGALQEALAALREA